jgi:hypothetical protein
MNLVLRPIAFSFAMACCIGIGLTSMPAVGAAPAPKESWYLSRPDGSKTYGFTSLAQCRASKVGGGGSCARTSLGAATSNAHAYSDDAHHLDY